VLIGYGVIVQFRGYAAHDAIRSRADAHFVVDHERDTSKHLLL
jgi:hypothetical protein